LTLKFILKLDHFGEQSLDLCLNLEGDARQLNGIVVAQSSFVDALYEILTVF
jgi:hypothetical protein